MVRLTDVLERQRHSLNLLLKLVVSLILERFCCYWLFSGVLEQLWNFSLLDDHIEHSRIKIKQCNWTE